MAAKHLETCYKLSQRFCFSGFSILEEVGVWLHAAGNSLGQEITRILAVPSPAAALGALNGGICQSYYPVLACIFPFRTAQPEERGTGNLITMLLLGDFHSSVSTAEQFQIRHAIISSQILC